MRPTQGDFYSNGVDGTYESSAVRKFTNVCPQFDILWPELSIYDHILLICRIKGLKGSAYRKFAIELMGEVNLAKSVDEKIGNLSGGMRRRVSIALATIGDPRVSLSMSYY